jgi:hypothetical protein
MVAMGPAKATPRKSTVKKHDATLEERERADLFPKERESLFRQLRRRPPRRSGGDPG